LSIWWWKI